MGASKMDRWLDLADSPQNRPIRRPTSGARCDLAVASRIVDSSFLPTEVRLRQNGVKINPETGFWQEHEATRKGYIGSFRRNRSLLQGTRVNGLPASPCPLGKWKDIGAANFHAFEIHLPPAFRQRLLAA